MTSPSDLAAEISLVVAPLSEVVAGPAPLAAYFRALGYELDEARAELVLTGIAPEVGALTAAFEGGEDDIAGVTVLALAALDLVDALAGQVAIAMGAGTEQRAVFDDVFSYLLKAYLSLRFPFAVAVLDALGVLVRPKDAKVQFLWTRIPDAILRTDQWALDVYGWGTDAGLPPFDQVRPMARIARLVEALQIARTHVRGLTEAQTLALLGEEAADGNIRIDLPLLQVDFVDVGEAGEPLFGTELGFSLLPFRDPADRRNAGFAVSPYVTGPSTTGQWSADGVEIVVSVAVDAEPDSPPLLAMTPRGRQSFAFDAAGELVPAPDPDFRVTGALTYRRASVPLWVIGSASGTRVQAAGVRFEITVEASDEIVASLSVLGLEAAVELGEDDLLGSVFDGPVRIPLGDLTGGFSSRTGGFVDATLGATGNDLTRSLPLNLAIGPVRITRVDLALRSAAPESGGLRLTAAAGVEIGLLLGPVRLALSSPGVRALLDVSGDAPGRRFGVELVPPTGAAVVVDAGPVTGGGAIHHDAASGRYTGALALRLQRVSVQAFGLLDTRGGAGFSLLLMLSARFLPGIQLGFGVTLTRVGGLVGVNRRLDVDALRARYENGSATRVLTAEDPLRDREAVLTELSEIFPPADGVYVVGPTLQLTWVKIVTLDVGLFLEFPGPTRAVVLGTARASVEHPAAEGPLLRLRCDFVGVLDLVHGTFAFDAVLVESRLLESFPVTGGLLFRAAWGAEPYALFSVGGFHPDFAPGALIVPKTLTRLAMSSGAPDDELSLRFEGYFAITPNTVQFGASVEVTARLSGSIRVRGFVEFDALIRFEPFHFEIAFSCGMQVQWRGRTLAGLRVSGTLSGPGPVRFSGRVCIELLFFDVCAGASFELGSDAPPAVSAVPSVLEVLGAQLRDPENLRAFATDRAVALRTLPPSVLPPTGVVWEQTRAPLGLLLERFEGSPLRRAERIEIDGDDVSGEEQDWFAPGGFTELTDAEALTRRSFERLRSGARLATGPDVMSDGVDHAVTVREFRVPAAEPASPRPPLVAPPWLVAAGQVREGRFDGQRLAPRIAVRPERWQVVDAVGQPLATAGEAQAHQLARVRGAVALPVDDLVAVTDL